MICLGRMTGAWCGCDGTGGLGQADDMGNRETLHAPHSLFPSIGILLPPPGRGTTSFPSFFPISLLIHVAHVFALSKNLLFIVFAFSFIHPYMSFSFLFFFDFLCPFLPVPQLPSFSISLFAFTSLTRPVFFLSAHIALQFTPNNAWKKKREEGEA